jgi:hypothetical protein
LYTNDPAASSAILKASTNSPSIVRPLPLDSPRQIEFFDYAEKHGLALLPIPFGCKEDKGWKEENRIADPNLKPIVWRWSKECSKDRTQWRNWYAQHFCNFGIIAAASGGIWQDIDVSKDPDLYAKYCEFWTSRGLKPPAPQFQSARKGWHVLTKAPAGFDFDSVTQSELMPNVDTRVDGYIVAPGSYYDGTAKGEDSGWYAMIAGASPPHEYDPAIFKVLVEALSHKTKPGTDVDLSLLPPIDEIVARIQNAYDFRDPAVHANNPDPADRARREANGYFAHYAEWMPVVGAVHALYGQSAKAKVAPIMRRGRDHASDMFESAWSSKPPAAGIAHASLLRFISASNHLGFNDGGRFAKAKGDQAASAMSSALVAAGTAAEIPSITSNVSVSVSGSISGATSGLFNTGGTVAGINTQVANVGSGASAPLSVSGTFSGSGTGGASSNNTGGVAHNNVQPSTTCNFIVRVI